MSQFKIKAQHSSATPEWGTPRVVIDIAHKVLGGIDLDPFSSESWNSCVRANRFLDEEANGFTTPWFWEASNATALVNPPGDPRGDNVKRAWTILEAAHYSGYVSGGAIWVAFNIGQLQTLQQSGTRSPLHRDFVRCIPRRRLMYQCAPGIDGAAPPHASAIVLLPALGHAGRLQANEFERAVAALGEVF